MKNKLSLQILICLTFIFSLFAMVEERSNPWPKRAKDGENGRNGYQSTDGQPGGHGQNGRNGQDGGHGGNGGNSDEGRGGDGGNGGDADWPLEDSYSLFPKDRMKSMRRFLTTYQFILLILYTSEIKPINLVDK